MSDSETARTPISDARLARLPIFPLPSAQLFPGAVLPLHIFEPRYRALVEHVLKHGQNAMAVATLESGYEDDYEGRPPVHPIMGAGVILAAERQKDGRWNVLLRGTARVHMLEELPPTRAFREVRAVRLMEREVEPGHPLEERLRALITQLADHAAEAARPLHLIASQSRDGAMLSNLIGAHACSDPRLRRKLLECTDVEKRLQMACTHLGRLVLEVAEPPAGGAGTLH